MSIGIYVMASLCMLGMITLFAGGLMHGASISEDMIEKLQDEEKSDELEH